MPTIAYIGLGSNKGDRRAFIDRAAALLARAGRVTAVSSYYATDPVGREDQAEFLNAAAAVETELTPEELLDQCAAIERELGRTREVKWGPRTIDLDILLYGDRVIETPRLTVPHPRLAERRFALVPLAELAAGALHPVLNKTVAVLLRELRDPHRVILSKSKGGPS